MKPYKAPILTDRDDYPRLKWLTEAPKLFSNSPQAIQRVPASVDRGVKLAKPCSLKFDLQREKHSLLEIYLTAFLVIN